MKTKANVTKKTRSFWQFWTCPKCGEKRSVCRRSASEGKTVHTYCSQRCQSSPVFVVREEGK